MGARNVTVQFDTVRWQDGFPPSIQMNVQRTRLDKRAGPNLWRGRVSYDLATRQTETTTDDVAMLGLARDDRLALAKVVHRVLGWVAKTPKCDAWRRAIEQAPLMQRILSWAGCTTLDPVRAERQVQFEGTTYAVHASRYASGAHCLDLYTTTRGVEPMRDRRATMEMPNCALASDEVYLKDYTENAGIDQALLDAGIIGLAGHCREPVYKLLAALPPPPQFYPGPGDDMDAVRLALVALRRDVDALLKRPRDTEEEEEEEEDMPRAKRIKRK
jgi:hypothetical protein